VGGRPAVATRSAEFHIKPLALAPDPVTVAVEVVRVGVGHVPEHSELPIGNVSTVEVRRRWGDALVGIRRRALSALGRRGRRRRPGLRQAGKAKNGMQLDSVPSDTRLPVQEVELRIEDVEMHEQGRWGLIHVRRSWDKHEGYVEPKSAAAARTIPIPEQLYEILDEHLLRLDRTEGLIFGRTAETPFTYSGVRARAARVLEDAGFEPADFQMHEARHSYRTFLAAAGIPRDRRDRYLGHTDGSVGGRYEHQLEHQYLDDARTLGEYLARADTPARIEELGEIEIQDEVRDTRATVRDAP
jgi:Phage integrase family